MEVEAMLIRSVFAAMRDSEVRFGIGHLDDFSLQWHELPETLKDKWRYVARTVKEGFNA